MKKFKTLYHVLDDFGEVLKVTVEKPSEEFQYVKEKVEIFDTEKFEESLF